LCIAQPAAADNTPAVIAPGGSGLTAPAGVVRDNGANLWIADAVRGVCRVDPALPGGSALVVDAPWCDPPGAAAPVDGAPVTRPATALQMAYDAASSVLFVAEGSSHSSGVWRFGIDAALGKITSGQKIVFEADRVMGLTLGTAAGKQVLEYTTKRSTLIRQLAGPVTCTPCSPIIAGSAQTAGATSLADLGGTLYIAEPTAVTRLDNPGPSGGIAQVVPNFPGGVPSSVAVDAARGRVYAGTLNGNNVDQVDVLTPSNGAIETYATGLTGVTALLAASNGDLIIGDDPAHGAGTSGSGQLLSVGLQVLGRPRVTITGGPPTFTRGANAGSYTFSGPAGSTFECRLDAANPAAAWTACGAGPAGSFTIPQVGEGAHVFEVRGVSSDPAIGAGPTQRRTFVVDVTPPHVSIDNPAGDQILTGTNALTLRISSNDGSAAFACSLDGQAPVPCSDPKRYVDLAPGDHVVAVTATDAAGNASAPVTFSFTVRPAVSATLPAPAPAGDARTSLAPVAGPAGSPVARLSTALRPLSMRLVRARTTLAKLRHNRRVVALVRTPHVARAATIALWAGAKSSVPVAQASLRLSGNGTQHLALTLTLRQAARLRTGSYLVGVTLGDGSSLYGPPRFGRLAVVR
jgi:hypothetical protein